MVDGWWMADGRWSIVDGRWLTPRAVDGWWSMVVGRWSGVDGRNGVLLIFPRFRRVPRVRRSPLDLRAEPTHLLRVRPGPHPSPMEQLVQLEPPQKAARVLASFVVNGEP